MLLAESCDSASSTNTDNISNQNSCNCQSDQSEVSYNKDQSNLCPGNSDSQLYCSKTAGQSGCCKMNQSYDSNVTTGMEKLSIFNKKSKPVIDF